MILSHVAAADLDEMAVSALEPLIASETLGVLVGAGASVAAGLPDWNELSERLLVKTKVVSNDAAAERFLARQDPQLAAEAARNAAETSGEIWMELIRQALYGSEEAKPDPSPLHFTLASLAAARESAGRSTGLFTLNFDELLEDALRADGTGQAVVARSSALDRAGVGVREVNHLHGTLPFIGDGANVVLTLSDFTSLAGSRHPWQVAALQEQLSRGPLLLTGTSYRDPDIRQWLSDITSTDIGFRDRLSIVLSRAALDLSREEFAGVSQAVVDQWEAIGFRVVVTDDYADSAQLISEMAWRTLFPNETYLPPRQRAARLWEAHETQFTTLQAEYAAQLGEDVRTLQARLPDAILTLWLADGVGGLARWSGDDRVYQWLDRLMRIRPGFDSRWVTGQAVGADETLLESLEVDATRRWRSVVASPVRVEVPGGPPFTAAAISSATTANLVDLPQAERDQWVSDINALTEAWQERLLRALD